jgi:hypothetical protein
MSEDRALQALRALAENDFEAQASPDLEARLLREFRSRRPRQQYRWPAIAALAAGGLIAAFLLVHRAPEPAASAVRAVPKSAPESFAVAQPEPTAMAVPSPRKMNRKLIPLHLPERREVVTDFFPLMSPAPPFERGQMLRVQLPAAAMRTVGLPVREEHMADPIQADVLVGEEGMPRAIRFVRFDVQ